MSLTLARREVPVMEGLRLFLLESWTSDPTRLDAARVPDERREYRTKPEVALADIDRMCAGGILAALAQPPPTRCPHCQKSINLGRVPK